MASYKSQNASSINFATCSTRHNHSWLKGKQLFRSQRKRGAPGKRHCFCSAKTLTCTLNSPHPLLKQHYNVHTQTFPPWKVSLRGALKQKFPVDPGTQHHLKASAKLIPDDKMESWIYTQYIVFALTRRVQQAHMAQEHVITEAWVLKRKIERKVVGWENGTGLLLYVFVFKMLLFKSYQGALQWSVDRAGTIL